MTARQLIAQLEQYQPDATVTLGTPYGAFEVERVELENAFASDHAVAIVAGEVAGEGKDQGPTAQDVRAEGAGGRVKCQVCGRMLAPLGDGTSRNHYAPPLPRGAPDYDRDYCHGSGYRLARWPVGTQLRHHAGDRWEVVEDRGGKWGDYWLRCLAGREAGREMVAHGEYMHRNGWTPLPPDQRLLQRRHESGPGPHANASTAEPSPNPNGAP